MLLSVENFIQSLMHLALSRKFSLVSDPSYSLKKDNLCF